MVELLHNNKWIYWSLLTDRNQSYLPLFLSHTLTLTCHVNTLVFTILLPQPPAMLLLYQFWLTEICKAHPTRDEMHDLQIAFPMTLMLLFFYNSRTLRSRHIRVIFELWGRPYCLSAGSVFQFHYIYISFHIYLIARKLVYNHRFHDVL